MRVYKFLNAHFGMKSLYERRLKISRIDELNDPFELIPFNLVDKQVRFASHQARNQLGATVGVLCFSARWRDPVLWAHYADKHYGLCLGFDLPDGGFGRAVTYLNDRLPFNDPPTQADSDAMLFTKFSNWAYEEEFRAWVDLENDIPEDGIHYFDFGNHLRLVEVIGGARCSQPRSAIERALGPLLPEVKLIKARAAFQSFEVVEDQRGWQ